MALGKLFLGNLHKPGDALALGCHGSEWIAEDVEAIESESNFFLLGTARDGPQTLAKAEISARLTFHTGPLNYPQHGD